MFSLIKLLFMGAAMAAIAGAGAVGGAKLQHALDNHQVSVCADGIRHSEIAKACPSAIADAYSALAAPAMAKEIQYRDRTVSLISKGDKLAGDRAKQLAADLAAIKSEDQTDACASSPAFSELRRQLRQQAGGQAGPQPQADPPAR